MTEMKDDASPSPVREVQPADVDGLLAQGAVLIDIRERAELEAEGMIPGAVHAPLGGLASSVDPASPTFIAALDPTTPVVLYCRSGSRSARAAALVERMGYGDVTSLQGGIRRWKTEGRPVAAPQNLI